MPSNEGNPDTVTKVDSAPESSDESHAESSPRDGTTENNKPTRPTTADLLHLKQIVERGEFAGPTIIETVQCEKDMEDKAFQRLVEENVRLDRELKKAEKKLAGLQHDYDVKFVELDSQKDKTEDLQQRVKDLERQLDKHKNKKPSKYYEDEETFNNNNNVVEMVDENEQIRDLQLRLTRLANDQEERDRKLEEMKKELELERAICGELEGHVDSGRVAEIRRRHVYEAEHGKTKQVRHNVVDSRSQKSAVCVVM